MERYGPLTGGLNAYDVIDARRLSDDAGRVSDDGEPRALQIALHLLGLTHGVSHKPEELAVALLHALSIRVVHHLRRTMDLENAVLGRSCVVGNLHGALSAFGRDSLERACHDADAVLEEGAVGGVVDVALDHGRVGAEFVALRDALGPRLLDNALVNGARSFVTEHGERAAEGCVVGDGVLIESSEASIDEAAAKLPLELA